MTRAKSIGWQALLVAAAWTGAGVVAGDDAFMRPPSHLGPPTALHAVTNRAF